MNENILMLYMLICAISASVGAASLFLYTPVGAFTPHSRISLRIFFAFFPVNVIALMCLSFGQIFKFNVGLIEALYYAVSVIGYLLIFTAIKWRRGVEFNALKSPFCLANILFWVVIFVTQQKWFDSVAVIPLLAIDTMGKANIILICGLSLYALKDRVLKNAGERLLSMTLVLSMSLSVTVFGVYLFTMDEILRYANLTTSNILITVLTVGGVYCAFFFDRINAHRTEAETDFLSGMLNRRAFMRIMSAQNEDDAINVSYGVIVMADIDNFKVINDKYGHDIGDIVIKRVASIFHELLRHNDLCARMGGEEFSLFISDIDAKKAHIAIDRIRKNIEASVVEVAGFSIKFTASFGYAEINKDTSLTDALREADHAMYASKQSGRNRVCAYTSDMQ